ncbi:MAG: N-acetylmuramoyl-L-alanine amidase [Pikeienuella sp.]
MTLRRGRMRAAAALATVGLALLMAGDASDPAAIAAPSPGFDGEERLSVDLAARVGFVLFTLDDPPRVVVDFPELAPWTAPVRTAAGMRLFGNLRFGRDESGEGARLVVDLRRPARVARVHTEATAKGARLVLDLAPTGAAEFAALAGWPAGERPPSLLPAPETRKEEGALIVIDAGHGGADPGAISRGVAEKDLVLAYARALKAAIDALPGLRAELTRVGDEYLSLDQRVAIAREAGAAAFLSLHADALAAGEATGASVYVLGEAASDRHAAALASGQERAEKLIEISLDAEESDVKRALLDLARRRAGQGSRALAARLVESLRRATPVLEGRALQSAGFRVLTAPEIPSALIELGFMSSAADRARLLSAEGRDAVVGTIAEAVAGWVAAR